MLRTLFVCRNAENKGVEAKRCFTKPSNNLAKFVGGMTKNIYLSSLKIQCCKIQRSYQKNIYLLYVFTETLHFCLIS
jgi:hypothetical protein